MSHRRKYKHYHTFVVSETSKNECYLVHDMYMNSNPCMNNKIYKRYLSPIKYSRIENMSEIYKLSSNQIRKLEQTDNRIVSNKLMGFKYFQEIGEVDCVFNLSNTRNEFLMCKYCNSQLTNVEGIKKIKKFNYPSSHVSYQNPSDNYYYSGHVSYQNPSDNYYYSGRVSYQSPFRVDNHSDHVHRMSIEDSHYRHSSKAKHKPIVMYNNPWYGSSENHDNQNSELNDIDQMLLDKAITESLRDNATNENQSSKSEYINSPRFGPVLRGNCPDDEPDLNEYTNVQKLTIRKEKKEYTSLDERINAFKDDISAHKIKCKIKMSMNSVGLYRYDIEMTEEDISSDEAVRCSICLYEIFLTDIYDKVDDKYEHVSVCKCEGTIGLMHRNCYINSIKNEFVKCTICNTNYYKPDEIDNITEKVLHTYNKDINKKKSVQPTSIETISRKHENKGTYL